MPDTEDTGNEPDEQPAVTGRQNDIPIRDPEDRPDVLRNSTLADRAKARTSGRSKQIADAENKAVQSGTTKSRRKKG
jgi:hypothetical protein